MKQSEIIAAVAGADIAWVEVAPSVEVMALPLKLNGAFVAVSARTAQACADALTRDGWWCTLTTPKVEDMIFEQAALKPEPVLLSPNKFDIASEAAIAEHSKQLSARIGDVPPGVLVSCGKSWVLSNGLLSNPGKAANYGFFSASGKHESVTKAHRLWQPLAFAHNADHFDYSQMLRLVRRRPPAELPSYDEPLRVPQAIPALAHVDPGLVG